MICDNTNLLDRTNKINPKINTRDYWSHKKLKVIKTSIPLNHYDLDHLITIKPNEYQLAKETIGSKILSIITRDDYELRGE